MMVETTIYWHKGTPESKRISRGVLMNWNSLKGFFLIDRIISTAGRDFMVLTDINFNIKITPSSAYKMWFTQQDDFMVNHDLLNVMFRIARQKVLDLKLSSEEIELMKFDRI